MSQSVSTRYLLRIALLCRGPLGSHELVSPTSSSLVFFFLPRVESNEENQPPFSVRENDMYLETSAESQLPSHVPI